MAATASQRRDCRHENPPPSPKPVPRSAFSGFRFPPDVIVLAVNFAAATDNTGKGTSGLVGLMPCGPSAGRAPRRVPASGSYVRAGTTTSHNSVKLLSRSGCGPEIDSMVWEMNSSSLVSVGVPL